MNGGISVADIPLLMLHMKGKFKAGLSLSASSFFA